MKKYKRFHKSATSMVWVDYWIEHFDSSNKHSEIYADELEDGRWRCEINLPLICDKIVSTSKTEVGAIKNASDKAARVINQYMNSHPELSIQNPYKGKNYIFEEDDYGRYKSAHLSNLERKRMANHFENANSSSIKIIQNAIKRIAKLYGTSDNLLIQVLDQSLFDDDKPICQILNEYVDQTEIKFNTTSTSAFYDKDIGKFILIGFSSPIPCMQSYT